LRASAEFSTLKTGKARFWTWLEPFSGKILCNLLVVPYSLGSGLTTAVLADTDGAQARASLGGIRLFELS